MLYLWSFERGGALELSEILSFADADCFGVCDFRMCHPLLECRGIDRIPAGARSVILFVFPYYTGEYSGRNVARYAVCDDYHRVAGNLLEEAARRLEGAYPGEAFVPFVDSSPIREVEAAWRAGLGAVGRHGQLIHPRYGTHVFLGELVTTRRLPPAGRHGGVCRCCGLCVKACPTGALTPGRALNTSRCRSAITQKKGALTGWEEEQVRAGGLVWGCDLCTDACPMNTGAPTPIEAFYNNPAPSVHPDGLDSLMRDKPYGYRGSRVLLRNYEIIHRS